jgi:hypothetical protein
VSFESSWYYLTPFKMVLKATFTTYLFSFLRASKLIYSNIIPYKKKPTFKGYNNEFDKAESFTVI